MSTSKIKSKTDPETCYFVNDQYIRMVRDGDSLTMRIGHIPEIAKRFKSEIQEELMDFWRDRFPAKPCNVCGKMFHGAKQHMYCSDECRGIGTKQKRADYREVYREMLNQPRECERCGKVFSNGNNRKYCSEECKKAATYEKQQETYERKRRQRMSQLDRKVLQAEEMGVRYADLQKQETLKMVGRVVI